MSFLAAEEPGAGFGRAARFQVLRERISSFYTLCYGFHRPLYRRLSAVLEDGVWPPFPDAGLLSRGRGAPSAGGRRAVLRGRLRRLPGQRSEEVEAVRDVVVPDVVFGDEPAPFQDSTPSTSPASRRRPDATPAAPC